MSTGVEPAVRGRASESKRLALEEKLPDQSHSLRDAEVRTVQHRRPASTMSPQERIAELREIRERHAGDPLVIDACDTAIKALGSGPAAKNLASAMQRSPRGEGPHQA
jgi:hypothetical protein